MDVPRRWSPSPLSDPGAQPRLSRRRLLKGAGAAGGLLLGSHLAWGPAAEARAGATDPGGGSPPAGSDPRPIPHSFFSFGNEFGYHIYPPSEAYPSYGSQYFEPSTIYDFQGRVATLHVLAPAVETDKTTGQSMPADSMALFRTMDGVYVGWDGKEREGVFTFI